MSYLDHPPVLHLSGAYGAGQPTAVVGPNGAGKSTLQGALTGRIHNFEGSLEHDPALRRGHLPHASALARSFAVRVRELVAIGLWSRICSFGGLRHDDQNLIDPALAAVGLGGFGRRWLGELPTGRAQRVLFGARDGIVARRLRATFHPARWAP